MPDRAQKYKADWGNRRDCNNFLISEYLRPVPMEPSKAKCLWCGTTFSVSDGFNAVTKHAACDKHVANGKARTSSVSIVQSFSKAKSL